MFALISSLMIAAAVLTDAPEPEAAAAPSAPSTTHVIAGTNTTPVPVNTLTTADICNTVTTAELENLPNYGKSAMYGFQSLTMLQPCTLAPNKLSVSLSYENMTTVRGSRESDRVFLPNALIQIGSLDPNLTFTLLVPSYSPGHTRDVLLDDGDHRLFTSEPGNSDMALGGTYRFDNRTSPFALGFTGLAILPTSTRGSGTEALGGITSFDVGLRFGPMDIDTSLAERFTTGEISPLSPFTVLSGKGPKDKGSSDCYSYSSYSYGSGSGITTPITSFRDLGRSDDRDKEYFSFNPSVSVGAWVPTFPSEPTFIYLSGSYFTQTSADTESSRAAYHIGIVQPITPRINIGADWGLSPSTDDSRYVQRALSTNISMRF